MYKSVDWIRLAQSSVQWRASLNAVSFHNGWGGA
jgi:hypothetical protein